MIESALICPNLPYLVLNIFRQILAIHKETLDIAQQYKILYDVVRWRERAFDFMKGCVKMRMRTIDQAAEYVRAIDPDTALTKTAIRRKVIAGEIPSSRAGRKYLLDLDRLEEFLFSPSDGAAALRG